MAADTRRELSAGMPWGMVYDWLSAHGFEIVAQSEYTRRGGTVHTVIAAHREHKLLLHARSTVNHGYETLNDAFLYGAIRQREGIGRPTFFAGINLAAGGPYEGNPLFGRFDADTQHPLGLMLEQMQVVGEFVNWGLRPPYGFIELRDLEQTYDLHADWVLVLEAFLDVCPPWVREFMISAP